jgi:hypothetical protein
VKFLNQLQTPYGKKNWSSAVLFNNARREALTPNYVNPATGQQLHRFKWLGGDAQIGALPAAWNHLVGYSAPMPDAANVHHTLWRPPYFEEFVDCKHVKACQEDHRSMLRVDQCAQAPRPTA